MPARNPRKPEGTFYRDLGRAVKIARVAAGKSQEASAAHLDISFAQFQKYESGENRIPVDRLVSLASFFKVPLTHLISPSAEDEEFMALAEKFTSSEFQSLVEAWGAIRETKIRSALLHLVQSMAALKR
jgi:transcriptional regulator with XRE-family HTH domain